MKLLIFRKTAAQEKRMLLYRCAGLTQAEHPSGFRHFALPREPPLFSSISIKEKKPTKIRNIANFKSC